MQVSQEIERTPLQSDRLRIEYDMSWMSVEPRKEHTGQLHVEWDGDNGPGQENVHLAVHVDFKEVPGQRLYGEILILWPEANSLELALLPRHGIWKEVPLDTCITNEGTHPHHSPPFPTPP